MIKKILIILGLIVTVALVSQTFDGDFGWHLRFGRDVFTGDFPYLDFYTYPYFGEEWVNHEWGGDIIFWFLYSNLGYLSLVFFVSVCLWSSFLTIQKHYFKRLTPLTISLAILFLLAIKFLAVMRLSMLSAVFFALIITGLEKARFSKSYYSWPILLWLWSAIHGSWILGFIVINIYALGAGLALMTRNRFGREVDWDKKTFSQVYIWQIFSAILITLNPYGFKIWQEVGSYFTQGFFKQYITEWLPSYAYPVMVWPLLIAAVAIALILWGFKAKKISIPQLMVFAAIFLSAWCYRRNHLYLILLTMPIITYTVVAVKQRLTGSWKMSSKIVPAVFWIMVIVVGFVYFVPQVYITDDVWRDEGLLKKYGFPLGAANYLQSHTRERTTSVFNEFWWGGYLNWRLNNILVYLDGRGTATWEYEPGKTALQSYRELKYSPGGLHRIGTHGVEYILLEKNISQYSPPDYFNSLIFSSKDLNKLFVQEPIPLLEDLRVSPRWRLVYEDDVSELWQKN